MFLLTPASPMHRRGESETSHPLRRIAQLLSPTARRTANRCCRVVSERAEGAVSVSARALLERHAEAESHRSSNQSWTVGAKGNIQCARLGNLPTLTEQQTKDLIRQQQLKYLLEVAPFGLVVTEPSPRRSIVCTPRTEWKVTSSEGRRREATTLWETSRPQRAWSVGRSGAFGQPLERHIWAQNKACIITWRCAYAIRTRESSLLFVCDCQRSGCVCGLPFSLTPSRPHSWRPHSL